jgi:WD40 repeat protein
VPDRAVTAVVHHGATTYLGGFFNWVGPWTGAGASLSVPSGASRTFPIVAGGQILAAAPDGGGGAYIGGTFTSVGGHAIARLAHIFSDGTVDASFNPNPNSDVTALAFVPGTGGGLFTTSTLYVGGRFSSIGAVERDGLAALTLSILGSTVSDSFAPCPGYLQTDYSFDQPYPFAFAVSSTTVYVGGDFDYVRGGPADPTTHAPTCTGSDVNSGDLFAVNRSTGNIISTFLPEPGGEVYALALSPDGSTLYMGGSFDYVGNGSSTIERLAAVDASTGALNSSWNPHPGGSVRALQVSGSHVYVGGEFKQIGATPAQRAGVAELNGVGGAAEVTSFDAGLQDSPGGGGTDVRALALDSLTSPTRLAIGGYFATAGGADQLALADPTSGAITSGFAPQPGGPVESLVFTSASTLAAGGLFDSIGAVHRSGIVALDGYGHPLPQTFQGAANVQRLALSPDGSTIYGTGGYGAAAWSTTTGAKLPWTPPTGVGAIAVAPDDSVVYLGGTFTTVGGSPHVNLAAVSPTTGAPTSWRPDPDGAVETISLSPDGKTVYVGGKFQHIGTSVAARSDLAAVSAGTGDATSWNPNPNGEVTGLTATPDGSYVFVGGSFSQIGAQPQSRANLAELTAGSGNPAPFGQNSSPDSFVTSIALAHDGSVVYVGGELSHVSYTPVPGTAALDGGSGKQLDWTPTFGAVVNPGTIAADGDTVWTGSYGTQLGSDLRPYYAQFSTAPAPVALPILSAPVRAGAVVSCQSGGWSNAPATIAVGWKLDGQPITGVSGRTFTPLAGQVGHSLSCIETAANPGGSVDATSAAVRIAASPPPTLLVSAKNSRFRAAKGTTLTIRLSVPATVTMTLTETVTGHRVKGRCRTSSRHGSKCTIKRPAGTARFMLAAGTTRLSLIRVGGHRLRPGRYSAAFVATAGGSSSRPVVLGLTVVG